MLEVGMMMDFITTYNNIRYESEQKQKNGTVRKATQDDFNRF